MLPIIDNAKRAIEARARFVGVAVAVNAIAAVLATVSLFFFTLAAFVWAEAEYGTVTASLGLGLAFLALAAIIYIAARVHAHRFAEAAQAPASRQYLQDDGRAAETTPEMLLAPVGIAAGIEILRKIGARRLIPAFALSAVVLTALLSSNARAKDTAEKPEEKK